MQKGFDIGYLVNLCIVLLVILMIKIVSVRDNKQLVYLQDLFKIYGKVYLKWSMIKNVQFLFECIPS